MLVDFAGGSAETPEIQYWSMSDVPGRDEAADQSRLRL
jgi:hypothetical protein